jgi:hypothetical protein
LAYVLLNTSCQRGAFSLLGLASRFFGAAIYLNWGTVMRARKIAIAIFVGSIACNLGGCVSQGLGFAKPPTTPTASEIQTEAADIKSQAARSNPALSGPEYAVVGYQIARQTCGKYFDNLIAASNDVQMSKADLAAAGTAAAAIEALAKATTKTIGVTAAGVGLASVILDNYQDYALLTPYPVQTRTLILSAMDAYRRSLPPESATSLIDAADRVSGFAELCTYSNIASLAQQALAAAKPKDVNTSAPLFSDSDALTLQSINDALGLPKTPPLDDKVYAELAIIASSTGTPNDQKLDALIEKLLPREVSSAAYDTAAQVPSAKLKSATKLLTDLAYSNKAFSALITATKNANAQSIQTAKDTNDANQKNAAVNHLVAPTAVEAQPVAPISPTAMPQIQVVPQ